MKNVILLILLILFLFNGCIPQNECTDCLSHNRDTLFLETFDTLDLSIWKIVNNYPEGWNSGGSNMTGIVKQPVYTNENDYCLCIYSKKTKNITTGPYNSYAYFDLTNLNPDKILEIEFSTLLHSYYFSLTVTNISRDNEVVFFKVCRSQISIDRLEDCNYIESDTIRFRFDNVPDSYAGYPCYIDDIKIIEFDRK